MISGAGNRGAMPCESCSVQFSVFKRKRLCSECERCFCSGCLRRGGGAMCPPCRVLSTRPLTAQAIAHLKARDLQCFLQRQNVSTRGCVEKDELVSLCVSHVNSAGYRRRGARSSPAFTLKGITNNINEFISSTFDLRPANGNAPPAQRPPNVPGGCCNASHVHIVIPNTQPCSHSGLDQSTSERFSVTPGGERDVRVPLPAAGGGGGGGTSRDVSRSASRDSTHVESADCFEIEDLDDADAGWEFVTRPADPLPNDSEVLMCPTDGAPAPAPQPPQARARVSREHLNPELSPGPGLGERATSELELRSAASGVSDSGSGAADSASLQDEPSASASDLERRETTSAWSPQHVTLSGIPDVAALDALSVRQLKELLTRNRVEFRGCLERADLLRRAQMLYKDHAHYKDELDNLPIEECCKICMAAPLECVLLECGHIAACTECSKQLAECPICRQYVVRAVRFFRS